jgi:hypothetical protein
MCASLAILSIAIAPVPALAGNNGQELAMTQYHNWANDCFAGDNQNGHYTVQCVPTHGFATIIDRGYWWKGAVEYGPTYPATYNYVIIPTSQADNYTCWNADYPQNAYQCNAL